MNGAYDCFVHDPHQTIIIHDTLWFCDHFFCTIMNFRINKFFGVESRQHMYLPFIVPFHGEQMFRQRKLASPFSNLLSIFGIPLRLFCTVPQVLVQFSCKKWTELDLCTSCRRIVYGLYRNKVLIAVQQYSQIFQYLQFRS